MLRKLGWLALVVALAAPVAGLAGDGKAGAGNGNDHKCCCCCDKTACPRPGNG